MLTMRREGLHMGSAANERGSANKELTVEECLAELREMFGYGVYLLVEAKGIHYPSDYGDEPPLLTAHINVDHNPFFSQTLRGCMNHVRAWKDLNND